MIHDDNNAQRGPGAPPCPGVAGLEIERVTLSVASGIVLDSSRLVYGLRLCVRGNADVGVTMSVIRLVALAMSDWHPHTHLCVLLLPPLFTE